MLKKEIRTVGFDDTPFTKGQKGKSQIIGTIFRGSHILDGIISTEVDIDGNNATEQLIQLIKKTKFKPQLRAIFLDGIAFAGFNLIDIQKLYQKTKIPVIVIIRKMPNLERIKTILKTLKKDSSLIDKAGTPQKINKIYVQYKGTTLSKVKQFLRLTCTRSYIPEPIRVAHLIAQGITFGESKGNA
ncbi:MAG: DUF99 family protein [Candidatus Woesearchaeota archaeon]|jgi:hypothetical protein|nr:DUF99 family protein [Candidatus Woesearchaeota archaeon]MDP7324152.1 DUF99 family protein [Candidatus Woesearchaeota archaeon]MDP7458542.1 DUF99 family protein [Candidatus Woesearchaeota archaeon]